MKTLLKTGLAALLLPVCAQAYTSLQYNDPRNGGTWGTGQISTAIVDIVPQGDYAMYDLQMVLAAALPDGAKSKGDSLEITCNFDLPAGSVIKTASLLIDGVWTEAALMPRSEAHAIYEGVVQRRRDPLIVYKNYGDNYLFKIFPIVTGDTREMKLRYAVPSVSEGGSKSLALPWDLINASATTPELTVNIAKSEDFTLPAIAGAQFTATETGYTATVPAKIAESKPVFTSDIAAGAIRFDYSRNEQGIAYKLGFVPSELFKLNTGKKILFILDCNMQAYEDSLYSYRPEYDPETNKYIGYKYVYNRMTVTPVSIDTVAKYVGKMLSTVDASNSFNIVLKNSGTYTYANEWKACTPENIADAVAQISANRKEYSADMKELIASASKLINEENVLPVIVSNNNQFGRTEYSEASVYAQELINEYPLNKKLNAFDISQLDKTDNDAYYYRYNTLLSYVVSGYQPNQYSYPYSVYNTSYFASYFPTFYEADMSRIVLLEVSTKTDAATTYDKTVGAFSALPYAHYTEMGKAAAGTEFSAQVSFRYKGQKYSEVYTFPIGDKSNTLLEDAAAAQLIDMLNNTGDEYAKLEAKTLSGEHHVLTRNSALLSIDPDAEVTPCWTCPDWDNWFVMPWIGADIRNIAFSSVMDKGAEINTFETVTTAPESTDQAYMSGFTAAQNNCISNSTDLYNLGYEEGRKAAINTVDKLETVATITASPNPFAETLSIEVKDSSAAKFEMYDAVGKLMLSQTFEGNITLTSKDTAFASLAPGIYTIRVTTSNGEYTATVVKE